MDFGDGDLDDLMTDEALDAFVDGMDFDLGG